MFSQFHLLPWENTYAGFVCATPRAIYGLIEQRNYRARDKRIRCPQRAFRGVQRMIRIPPVLQWTRPGSRVDWCARECVLRCGMIYALAHLVLITPFPGPCTILQHRCSAVSVLFRFLAGYETSWKLLAVVHRVRADRKVWFENAILIAAQIDIAFYTIAFSW